MTAKTMTILALTVAALAACSSQPRYAPGVQMLDNSVIWSTGNYR